MGMRTYDFLASTGSSRHSSVTRSTRMDQSGDGSVVSGSCSLLLACKRRASKFGARWDVSVGFALLCVVFLLVPDPVDAQWSLPPISSRFRLDGSSVDGRHDMTNSCSYARSSVDDACQGRASTDEASNEQGASQHHSVALKGKRAVVNEHAVLQVRVSMHCAPAVDSPPAGALPLGPLSDLEDSTTWRVTMEELTTSSSGSDATDISQTLKTNEAIKLRWTDMGSSIYHGQATVSLVVPRSEHGTHADTPLTLIIALMEYPLVASTLATLPRIVTRKLANLPMARGESSSSDKSLRNPVVTVDLTGTTTCNFRSHHAISNYQRDSMPVEASFMVRIYRMLVLALMVTVVAFLARRPIPLNQTDANVQSSGPQMESASSPESNMPSPPSIVRPGPKPRRVEALPEHNVQPQSHSDARASADNSMVSPPSLTRRIIDPCTFGDTELAPAVSPKVPATVVFASGTVSAKRDKNPNGTSPDVSTPIRPRRICFVRGTPAVMPTTSAPSGTIITGSKSTCIVIDSDEDSEEDQELVVVDRHVHVSESATAAVCELERVKETREISQSSTGVDAETRKSISAIPAAARQATVAVDAQPPSDVAQNDRPHLVAGTSLLQKDAVRQAIADGVDVAHPVLGIEDAMLKKDCSGHQESLQAPSASNANSRFLDVEHVPLVDQLNWLQRLQRKTSGLQPDLGTGAGDVAPTEDEPDDFSYVSTLPPHSDATASEISVSREPDFQDENCFDSENAAPNPNGKWNDTIGDKRPFAGTAPCRSGRLSFNPFTSCNATQSSADPSERILNSLTGKNAKGNRLRAKKTGARGDLNSIYPVSKKVEARAALAERRAAPSRASIEANTCSGTKSSRSKPAFVPDTVVSQSLMSYSMKMQEPVWHDSPVASKAPTKTKRSTSTRAEGKKRRGPPLIIELRDGKPPKKRVKYLREHRQVGNEGRYAVRHRSANGSWRDGTERSPESRP